jgi:hypothetical protein
MMFSIFSKFLSTALMCQSPSPVFLKRNKQTNKQTPTIRNIMAPNTHLSPTPDPDVFGKLRRVSKCLQRVDRSCGPEACKPKGKRALQFVRFLIRTFSGFVELECRVFVLRQKEAERTRVQKL